MKFKVESLIKAKHKDLDDTVSKIIVTTKSSLKDSKITSSEDIQQWQLKDIGSKPKVQISGTQGPVWFITLNDDLSDSISDNSLYGEARESIGALISEVCGYKSKDIIVNFSGCSTEAIQGAIVGIELGLYRYGKEIAHGKFTFQKEGRALSDKVIEKAIGLGVAVNQARHLVNLPPNELNPVTYANEVSKMFSKSKNIKVEVFDEKKLKKEKCGLILSVGSSSNNPPRIVKITYAPKSAKGKPIAFVGKGLTFDSGGLNIKSGSGMRLMKKDMGGSATCMGIASWLDSVGSKKKVEIYLAMAENSISDRSSRPSDIVTARNGMTVEIHNTDAEGRLALADAIDIALESTPQYLIDVATLTGAGKVALGQDIASLFSNDDKLAQKLHECGNEMSDLNWRMPLYLPYFKDLKSDFADMVNSAGGFGGAITAALFLEKFVGKTKWAHLDIFGWTSSAKPSLVQKGGNGQAVEALTKFLS